LLALAICGTGLQGNPEERKANEEYNSLAIL